MALIDLRDVHLSFQVRRKAAKKPAGKRRRNVLDIYSLNGVTVRMGDGERVGVIGHNGAGKTTLLRFIAGVYPPTSGTRRVEGRISSLFDMKLGFENDATGRENVFLRGYVLGETPQSIREKMDSIIEFAELGEFIDTSFAHYSSGMRVRLGFAVATAIDPEILLLDECLSAGDRGFRDKARARMMGLLERTKLLVMVSHDLESVRQICTRVLWMEQGRVRRDGPPNEVLAEYREHMASSPAVVGAMTSAEAA